MLYDLIVIGAGPAGYLGAQRAADAGLQTLLIEKKFLGGICLNEGCIPSKVLLHSAKIYDYARFSEKYGVVSENVTFNHKTVLTRKNKVIKTLVAGIRSQLKKSNVKVIEGSGEIVGKNQEGYEIRIGDEIHSSRNLLIATGSAPVVPPIPGVAEGLEAGYILTNREILELPSIPESLAIIGGGIIGLEMASYFNSAGSKVTVIEMLDHIAGNTDRDISNILKRNYEKKGIDFKLSTKVTEIKDGTICCESNGERVFIKAEKVLLSVGRKPCLDGLGLENIGVEADRGGIKTDEEGRANVANVYAAGDVNGRSMLAHTAYREAEVCINNILGKKDIMQYNAIPSVIYTNPEVASVGETEETAQLKGLDYEAVSLSMRYSGRYLAENEGGDGICKLLINRENRSLIGVHLIGNYASEIIYGAASMIQTGMKVQDAQKIVFPHPTVSEIIREGIFRL